MEKGLTVELAEERLRVVNNNLSYFMKEKRNLQAFILKENERVKGMTSPKQRAWELKHDQKFIEENGRERTQEEIARIMHYSQKQIQRFLKEKN